MRERRLRDRGCRACNQSQDQWSESIHGVPPGFLNVSTALQPGDFGTSHFLVQLSTGAAAPAGSCNKVLLIRY